MCGSGGDWDQRSPGKENTEFQQKPQRDCLAGCGILLELPKSKGNKGNGLEIGTTGGSLLGIPKRDLLCGLKHFICDSDVCLAETSHLSQYPLGVCWPGWTRTQDGTEPLVLYWPSKSHNIGSAGARRCLGLWGSDSDSQGPGHRHRLDWPG